MLEPKLSVRFGMFFESEKDKIFWAVVAACVTRHNVMPMLHEQLI